MAQAKMKIEKSDLRVAELWVILNDIIEALASNNAGPTPPRDPFIGMFWADTSTASAFDEGSGGVLKQYKGNSGWQPVFTVGTTVASANGESAVPQNHVTFTVNTTTNELTFSEPVPFPELWKLNPGTLNSVPVYLSKGRLPAPLLDGNTYIAVDAHNLDPSIAVGTFRLISMGAPMAEGVDPFIPITDQGYGSIFATALTVFTNGDPQTEQVKINPNGTIRFDTAAWATAGNYIDLGQGFPMAVMTLSAATLPASTPALDDKLDTYVVKNTASEGNPPVYKLFVNESESECIDFTSTGTGTLYVLPREDSALTKFRDTIDAAFTKNIYVQTADSVVTGVAEGSVISSGFGSLNIPANTLTAGRIIEVEIMGTLAKGTGSDGTAHLHIKVHGSDALVADLSTVFPGNTFHARVLLACRTTGSTGVFQVVAMVTPLGGSLWVASAQTAINTEVVNPITATIVDLPNADSTATIKHLTVKIL